MTTSTQTAKIIASLRDDRLSIRIGARPFADFAEAYDLAVEQGVEMPDDLVAFRNA